jgi:Retrotransposon gag protein
VNDTPEDRVLRFVKHALRGDAYTWFRANQDDMPDWEACREDFIHRFGLDEETIMWNIETCVQEPEESVKIYSDRLRKLVGYLPAPLPARMVSQMFLKGLAPPLRERVQMAHPAIGPLQELIRLAAQYEQTFGRM